MNAETRPWTWLAIILVLLAGCAGPLAQPYEGNAGGPRLAQDDLLPDSDNDGLSDAAENFLFGSDPNNFSTTSNGIPDGWFARHGFDATIPGIEQVPAAEPSPSSLPAAYAGDWPSKFRWRLHEVYSFNRPPDWNETLRGPWDNGIDPTSWRHSSGLPLGWLFHYGLDLLADDVGTMTLTSDGLTVAEEFEHNTDPTTSDTDGDGLSDSDEIRKHGSDPRDPSTSGTGIPDGWLAGYGLDPADATIGHSDSALKGMTVLETYEFNAKKGASTTPGPQGGLHPNLQSTRGLSVPDGWLVRYGLDPLEPGLLEKPVHKASDFSRVRDLPIASAGAGLPDLVLTVEDVYRHGRPPSWDEPRDGPWWGGLKPNVNDQDIDGLPDAVELRGWLAERKLGAGPAASFETYVASSDPFSNDTDADGLTDLEEYDGKAVREGHEYVWAPSDPRSSDTSHSGLLDSDKVFGPHVEGQRLPLFTENDGVRRVLLEPNRADNDADYLRDGAEFELWRDHVRAAVEQIPYQLTFPGSQWNSYVDWFDALDWTDGGISEAEIPGRLAANGDVDDDGLVNILDDDADNDGLLDGWEAQPATLEGTKYGTGFPRSTTDPANPDTDADTLPDEWEVRYGRFGLQGWDLDAAEFSSRHDGISDAEGNLDDDRVTWFAFNAGRRDERTSIFTNGAEFLEGTDPRDDDENGDGLTDSWVYFWTRQYPLLLLDPNKSEFVGDVVPSQQLIDEGRARIGTVSTSSAAGSKQSSLAYVRFVEIVGPDAEYPRQGETFVSGWPRNVELPRGTTRLGQLQGQYIHTFLQDQSLGLNPYLTDTDGDDLPDAWETLHGRCPLPGGVGADPTAPDRDADPDGDGVTNFQEFHDRYDGSLLTTSPCIEDSDLGGLGDGVELGLGLSPLNPEDDDIRGGTGDRDHDGLADEEELRSGTSPLDPDTDHDGLLDGDDVLLLLHRAEDAEILEEWQARGLVHAITSDGEALFRGEKRFVGASPTNPDSSGDAVPDGWQALRNGKPGIRDAEMRPTYECGAPSWWNPETLGVWWWSLSLMKGQSCPRDLDLDGLDDYLGEDPVPAASHYNRPFLELPQALQPATSIADSLLWGQNWGECAGHPTDCMDKWPAADYDRDGKPDVADRAPVTFVEVEFDDGDEAPPFHIQKGPENPAHFRGRLVLKCGDAPCVPHVGVPQRTVMALLDQTDNLRGLVGIGYTDANGMFEIAACACATQSIIVPSAGMTALFRNSPGQATVTVDAANVALGPHSIFVRASPTTATFWNDPTKDASHPHHVAFIVNGETHNATGMSVTQGQPVLINSASELTIDGPTVVPWTPDVRQLTVTIRLRDGAQGPLDSQSVQVRLGTHQVQATTNVEGSAVVVFTLPANIFGVLELQAAFGGTNLVRPSVSLTRDIVVQRPIELAADGPSLARGGAVYRANVTVTSQGEPVPGHEVRAEIGPVSATAITNSAGVASFSIPLTGFRQSNAVLSVRTGASAAYASATLSQPLSIQIPASLHVTIPNQVQIGSELRLPGSLTTASGEPLPGRVVEALLGVHLVGEATTDGQGRFDLRASPTSLDAGPGIFVVRFAGDSQAGAVEASGTVQVNVLTRLIVDDQRAVRSETIELKGRLITADGKPVPGQNARLRLGEAEIGAAYSGPDGFVRFRYHVHATTQFGTHTIAAIYRGSDDGSLAPSTGEGKLLVQAQSLIRLEGPPVLERGNNTIDGHLAADDGTPIPHGRIQLLGPGASQQAQETTRDGRFRFVVDVSRSHPPGDVTFHAAYEGNETFGSANAQTTIPLVVQPSLKTWTPTEVGRGSTFRIAVSTVDDRGENIPNASVAVYFLGTESNATFTGSWDGAISVPANTTLGPQRLVIRLLPSAFHTAAKVERDVQVKDAITIELDVAKGEYEPGKAVAVTVRASDAAGNPVAGTILGVRFAHERVAILLQTNETGDAKVTMAAPNASTATVLATFAGDAQFSAAQQTSSPIRINVRDGASARDAWTLPIAGAALAACVAAAVIVIRRRRRDVVLHILQDAERMMAAGNPWSAAVIFAYRRLTAHLAKFGFHERAHETVREFLAALHQAVQIPADAAVQLATLFERARYDDGNLSPTEGSRARESLRSIIRQVHVHLGGNAVEPPGQEAGR